eukprot:4977436-Amphidinium_carterae.2
MARRSLSQMSVHLTVLPASASNRAACACFSSSSSLAFHSGEGLQRKNNQESFRFTLHHAAKP